MPGNDNKTDKNENVSISYKNFKGDFPVNKGTLGPEVFDITSLYNSSGQFTFDPGFTSTASCESAITYIDGNEGVLLHRGYSIEELAENGDFAEVCYLLLKGELPNTEALDKFNNSIINNMFLPEKTSKFFHGFEKNAHPMAIVCAVVASLSANYHNKLDINKEEHRSVIAHQLIGQIPTISAMAYKHNKGEDFVKPDLKLDYVSNFLHMMFSTNEKKFISNPVLTKAMSRIFILHADHEQNASTSTVRLEGSSGANPYACIAAGIASLWGPAHGGANEAV